MMNTTQQQSPLWERLSPSAYRSALSVLPTSVVAAAGMRHGEPVGMIVGTFSTISMEPPLVGFFGDHRSTTLEPLLECENLSFSLLGQDDLDICDAFRLPLAERFSRVPFEVSSYDTPVITGASLVVHTRLDRALDIGDHTCVVATVLDVETPPSPRRPLLFYRHRLSRIDPGQLLHDEMWQLGWNEHEDT